MATASAFDTHVRLRPVVREIVGVRLAARGLRLEDERGACSARSSGSSRATTAPAPADRHAAGIPDAALRRAVERLEAL